MFDQFPKDKIVHIVFVAIIVALLGTSIYFRATRSKDTLKDVFLSKISLLDSERALQEIQEEPLPGAIKVPILIYHSVAPHRLFQTPIQRYYDVDPGSLEKQLAYLRDNRFVVIGLDFLADALIQNITLPPKSVVLTFDDGWENQFRYAYPVLKRYNYTATFFIFTRAIDRDNFLTWDQIKTMDGGGMTIGGHTRTHPYLLDIQDDLVTLRREIIGGKSVIENRLGKAIDLFAYPFGQYNDKIIEIVKEAGYKTARSVHKGVYNTKNDVYKLKGIEATDDFNQFVRDLNE